MVILRLTACKLPNLLGNVKVKSARGHTPKHDSNAMACPRFLALLAVGIVGAAAFVRAAPDPAAEAAYRRGRDLFAGERYEAAQREFEQALAPRAVGVHSTRNGSGVLTDWKRSIASLLYRPGFATRSRDALEKAVALDPDNVGARSDLAPTTTRPPPCSAAALSRTARRWPRSPGATRIWATCARGDLLVDDGHYLEAEKEYLAATALDARRAQAHERLGYFYTEGKLYEKAFAQYDLLLRNDPDEPRALYGLGKLAALTGQRPAEGEAALRRFLEHYQPDPDDGPSPARAHYFLGKLLADRGDKPGAAQGVRGRAASPDEPGGSSPRARSPGQVTRRDILRFAFGVLPTDWGASAVPPRHEKTVPPRPAGLRRVALAGGRTSSLEITFAKLTDEILADQFEFGPLGAVSLGLHQYDGKFGDYSRAAVDAEIKRAHVFLTRLEGIDPAKLSAPSALDYQLLLLGTKNGLFQIEEMGFIDHNPMSYAGAFDANIYLKRDYAPLADRLRSLVAVERQGPGDIRRRAC